MRAQKSVTGVGVTDIVPLQTRLNPFLVSATCYLGSGCTASIQYTVDDIQANSYSPSTGTWLDHPDGSGVNGVTGFTAPFTAPVTAVRLNQTVGANTSTLTVIQGPDS